MWLYSSSHPLGSLARNQQGPESIIETLISQNEHVPEHIKDTLVTPEIVVGYF